MGVTLADWCIAGAGVASIFAVVFVPEWFARRELRREWAKYDAERAAEAERQRLNPGSRPIPGGGVPSAQRPR